MGKRNRKREQKGKEGEKNVLKLSKYDIYVKFFQNVCNYYVLQTLIIKNNYNN